MLSGSFAGQRVLGEENSPWKRPPDQEWARGNGASIAAPPERSDDPAWFCSLGIKALRYPILWEHHQVAVDAVIDWSWTTRQLNALRLIDAAVNPVVAADQRSFRHRAPGKCFCAEKRPCLCHAPRTVFACERLPTPLTSARTASYDTHLRCEACHKWPLAG